MLCSLLALKQSKLSSASLLFFLNLSSRMAAEWTGSEPELVGESEAPTSAWEMVEEEKPKPEVVKAEVEEEVSKLADNLGQVVIDEPDFSTDDPKDDPPKEVISEDQKADDNPPDDQLSSNATPATDTQPPDQSAKLSTDSPPSTKPAVGLSALSPLQALEATEGEAVVQMGPPPVPQSKAAAMKKSGGKRQREFLVRMSDPTSGDDGEAPKIQDFLISSKATSAAKRASSVSAKKRHCPAPDKQRSRSQERSRSHGRNKDSIITSGPIRPLSSTRKKPQQMVPEGDLSTKGPQNWQQERLDLGVTQRSPVDGHAGHARSSQKLRRKLAFPPESQCGTLTSIRCTTGGGCMQSSPTGTGLRRLRSTRLHQQNSSISSVGAIQADGHFHGGQRHFPPCQGKSRKGGWAQPTPVQSTLLAQGNAIHSSLRAVAPSSCPQRI